MQKRLTIPHGKSYCPYTEKSPQAISSLILNPYSYAFGNGGKDTSGKMPPAPGNSACRNGRSLCGACYTAPVVFAQEGRPFQMPLLAPAHKSPSSRGFFAR